MVKTNENLFPNPPNPKTFYKPENLPEINQRGQENGLPSLSEGGQSYNNYKIMEHELKNNESKFRCRSLPNHDEKTCKICVGMRKAYMKRRENRCRGRGLSNKKTAEKKLVKEVGDLAEKTEKLSKKLKNQGQKIDKQKKRIDGLVKKNAKDEKKDKVQKKYQPLFPEIKQKAEE
ncbi:17648_t:CDS:2 [Gigaspora margarita]|uniref:17648_t:CDS:1 n=1 Tax=Gigaspora margarita TaxID=4874 RepID=A0ABM8VXF5_GIGMA|nr:17648_t:CDS:2 [Gigaspora margarita]